MKYIFITCQGHSGSTLLGKLLALHADALSVGEVKHFATYFAKNDSCGCGAPLQSCPFWTRVLDSGSFPDPLNEHSFPMEGVRAGGARNYFYFLSLFMQPWLYKWLRHFPSTLQAINWRNAQNHWRLMEAVVKTSGKSVIVDKSMSISRYQELFLTQPPGTEFLLIHLVRDGRANMYSYMKRYAYTAVRAAKRWHRINRKIETAKLFNEGHKVLELRYEDLIAAPEQSCQQIFGALGLHFQSELNDLSQSFDHSIGSNEDKLVGYGKIRLDRRWEELLSEEELAIFEKTAGKLNRKYGYH